MKVLLVADRLTDRGGAYRHLLGVLERLAMRHDVRLAVGQDAGTVNAPCPVHVARGLESRERVPVSVRIAGFEPDLVHVWNVVNPALLDWAAERPSLLTIQDHRWFCPYRGKWKAEGSVCRDAMRPDACAPCFEDAAYYREVLALTEERLAAARRSRVIVLSRYMRDELASVGVPADRIHVVPPFVHGLDPSAAADGPPCVLFVGRLVEAKGVTDAIEAWRRSKVALPLLVAGTGPLRELVASSGATVLGWVPHSRLAQLLRRARALVFPPRWQEPFGLAGLEALAMGTPVVAWESGGVREWHPGPLVEWGDVDGLAEELRAAVGRRAVAPSGFEADVLTERLEAVYSEAVIGPGARSSAARRCSPAP